MGLLRSILKLFAPPRQGRQLQQPAREHFPAPVSDERGHLHLVQQEPLRHVDEQTGQRIIKGRCWVIDGDTIVIDKTHIRLAGIDAPELDHPYGQNAKRALMRLCHGQVITAVTDGSTSHERAVALCHLADGRDLSAEMVKAGLALDWKKYSAGRYRHLEVEGIRKKLCRVDAKHKGRMPRSEKKAPQAAR